jgi:hypothetical protein
MSRFQVVISSNWATERDAACLPKSDAGMLVNIAPLCSVGGRRTLQRYRSVLVPSETSTGEPNERFAASSGMLFLPELLQSAP